jgi:hypothetical protein
MLPIYTYRWCNSAETCSSLTPKCDVVSKDGVKILYSEL